MQEKLFILIYIQKKMYTTLYYYLLEYGKLMLNPIFNLSYFLIGMYFGLINYSIQKNVNGTDRFSEYSKIMNVRETEDENDERKNSLDIKTSKSKSSFHRSSINYFDEEDKLDDDNNFEKNELDDLDNITFKKSNTSGNKNPKKNILKDDRKKDVIEIENESISMNNTILNKNTKESLISSQSLSDIKAMPFLIIPTNIVNFVRKTKKSFAYIFNFNSPDIYIRNLCIYLHILKY